MATEGRRPGGDLSAVASAKKGAEMASSTLGVGILGAGRVAGSHARAALQVPGVALRAVAEIDEARRHEFVQEYATSGVRAYADYRELLQQPDVELVLVALPHWLHAPATVDAAVAGKHVLVEKPMALSLDECDRMIEAARRHGVTLAVGQTHHFHAVPVAAKQLLDSGRFGRMVWGSEVAYSPRRAGSNPAWFFDRARGGGQLLANGVHYIDRLLWTIGARPAAVSAIVGTYFNNYPADDGCVAFIRFDTGQVATLHLSGHYHAYAQAAAEYMCTRGLVRYTGSEIWTTNPDDLESKALVSVPVERSNGFAAQLQDVVEAIRQGRPPAVPGEWGRLVMAVLFAAEESSRTGRAVRLEGRL
jgi:predicted dehydrogenase